MSETIDRTGREVPVATTPPAAGPRPALWSGLLPALGGLAVVIAAGGLLDGVLNWVRVALLGAGFAVACAGLARLGRRRFGAGFDLTTWLCTGWLAVLVVSAVLAPLLPLGEHEDIANTIDAPALARPDLFGRYPLGTNNFGLDLLARVVYGARVSLVVSLGAVVIGIALGAAIGIAAGYFRRTTDVVIGIFTNSLLAVPPLILLIALSTVLDPSLRNVAFALSLLALPNMIRIARANTMAFAQREFVLAAQAMGASRTRVMVRELLPNVLPPLAAYGMVMVSVLVAAEASLSFLGLGVQPPEPSWGNMIAEGEGSTFEDHPHVVLVPGVVLFLTVFSFNALGEKARKRFDPRLAKL